MQCRAAGSAQAQAQAGGREGEGLGGQGRTSGQDEKKGRLPNLARVGTAGSTVCIVLEMPPKLSCRPSSSPSH